MHMADGSTASILADKPLMEREDMDIPDWLSDRTNRVLSLFSYTTESNSALCKCFNYGHIG